MCVFVCSSKAAAIVHTNLQYLRALSIELSISENNRTSRWRGTERWTAESIGGCSCGSCVGVPSAGGSLSSSGVLSVICGYTECRRRSPDCRPSQRSAQLLLCKCRMRTGGALLKLAVLKINLIYERRVREERERERE